MRFTPKTEAEVQEAGLLPAGEYSFEVLEAEDKISKSGNEMIALKLGIEHEESLRGVFDYLLTDERMQYKLRHFADAVGVLKDYERGEMKAEDLVGLSGKCKIVIQPAKDGYDAKNSVRDYVKRSNGAEPEPVTAKKTNMDDDIPF